MRSPGDGFDLIVLGAGMAGINATVRAAETGARVALIERGRLGGTCPTRGCIPSKALIRSAEIAHEIRRAHEFGIAVGEISVDFGAVIDRVQGIVDRGSRGTQGYLESLKQVELILGEGAFESPTRIRIGDRRVHAPRIVIATGAEPTAPPIPGLAETGYLTSDDVLRLRELPARLTVIGGGPIGLEFGQAMHRLGAEVTILEALPSLLPSSEPELVEALAGHLSDEGLEILTGVRIDRVERSPDGTRRVIAKAGERPRLLECDEILVATGRRPALEALNLEATGIPGDGQGIAVDSRLRTPAPSVWAAGDVLGLPYGAFTHVARRLGVSAAENALGLSPHEADADIGPVAIFTDPELVSVGMSEASARDAGHQLRIGSSRFTGGKARAWGEERGMVKVVADASTGRILGAHILAYHGADLIHPILVAMKAGDGSGASIRAAFHVHPTLGEVVKAAVEQTLA